MSKMKMDTGTIAGFCFIALGAAIWGLLFWWLLDNYASYMVVGAICLIFGYILACLMGGSKMGELETNIYVLKKTLNDHDIKLPTLEN